jgi:hypothetical protein
MNAARPRSEFANLSPRAARAVLALTILAIGFCVAISLSPLASGFVGVDRGANSDVDLYHAEIARMADGQGYYAAASAELHERGYPTRSLFNWRTPLPMWLLATLPGIAGRLIIIGLSVLLLLVALHLWARDFGMRSALVGGLLLVGALLPSWLDRIYIMPEVWAGVLIALAICAYAADRRMLAIAVGIAALFVRELATPFCLICFALAVSNKRWKESAIWFAGFTVYVGFYAWHIAHVIPQIRPTDHAHIGSWLQYGGAAFVISLTQMNAFLLLLPQWVSSIYLPLAMLGFAGWKARSNKTAIDELSGSKHRSSLEHPATLAGLTASAYVILFAFIGHPFNQYWGSLIAPLFCFGIAQCPTALADLLDRSRIFTKSHEPVAACDVR